MCIIALYKSVFAVSAELVISKRSWSWFGKVVELVRKGRGVGTERSWSWFGKVVELVRIGRGVGAVTFPNQLDGYTRAAVNLIRKGY